MVEVNRMTTPANMRWKLIDRETGAENADIDWRFRVGDQVKIRLLNEMAGDHPMHHPFHVHGAGRFLVLSRDGVVEPNLVWKDTVLMPAGRDGRHPARHHQPRPVDGPLPHRRAPRERHDVQLQRRAVVRTPVLATATPELPAAHEHPLRTPSVLGSFGGLQGRSPLAFWWLNAATVYALGLALIASVYIGFAVRRRTSSRSSLWRAPLPGPLSSLLSRPSRIPWLRPGLGGSRPQGSLAAPPPVRCQHPLVAPRSVWSSTGWPRRSSRDRNRRGRAVPRLATTSASRTPTGTCKSLPTFTLDVDGSMRLGPP